MITFYLVASEINDQRKAPRFDHEGQIFRLNKERSNLLAMTEKNPAIRWHAVLGIYLLALSSFLAGGCSRPEFLSSIGTGGKYLAGKEEVTRRRGGNFDTAIVNLTAVVKEDPTYKDSLTLLGRAYYLKEMYRDAFQILQRALVVNPDDEIAWMALGIAQLRLADDEKGLKSLQGGLTLFGKVSTPGYRGFSHWDRAGKIKAILRRAVITVRNGSEGKKEDMVRAIETLLAAIDEEEWQLRLEAPNDLNREINGSGGGR
jgi:tetratricopeptide (TPR) repeat protein